MHGKIKVGVYRRRVPSGLVGLPGSPGLSSERHLLLYLSPLLHLLPPPHPSLLWPLTMIFFKGRNYFAPGCSFIAKQVKYLGIRPHAGHVLIALRAFIWPLELGTSPPPGQHHTWFQLEGEGLRLFIFWASLLLLEPRLALDQRGAWGGELDLETVPEWWGRGGRGWERKPWNGRPSCPSTTCSQTNRVKDGTSGLQVVAGFRSRRKGLLWLLVMRGLK